MEKLTAAQQQSVKKMSDESLRLKLVAAGYEEDVVVAMERETMLSTYAEVLASGGVRPEAPAQVGYNPDVEAQKLAFEKQRWEAEREDKLRREEAKLRREEVEREETRAQLLPRMADRTRAVTTTLFTSALRRIFSNR